MSQDETIKLLWFINYIGNQRQKSIASKVSKLSYHPRILESLNNEQIAYNKAIKDVLAMIEQDEEDLEND
ncbi:hypothetical protein ACW66K_06795 [Aerococcus urinaeequi]